MQAGTSAMAVFLHHLAEQQVLTGDPVIADAWFH